MSTDGGSEQPVAERGEWRSWAAGKGASKSWSSARSSLPPRGVGMDHEADDEVMGAGGAGLTELVGRPRLAGLGQVGGG